MNKLGNKTEEGEELEFSKAGYWQKCPNCNGSGIEYNSTIQTSCTPTCTVCNGKKIINTLTGLPPI